MKAKRKGQTAVRAEGRMGGGEKAAVFTFE